jgi:hypothetical protein
MYFKKNIDLQFDLKKRDFNYEIKFDISDLWMDYFVRYEGNKMGNNSKLNPVSYDKSEESIQNRESTESDGTNRVEMRILKKSVNVDDDLGSDKNTDSSLGDHHLTNNSFLSVHLEKNPLNSDDLFYLKIVLKQIWSVYYPVCIRRIIQSILRESEQDSNIREGE